MSVMLIYVMMKMFWYVSVCRICEKMLVIISV